MGVTRTLGNARLHLTCESDEVSCPKGTSNNRHQSGCALDAPLCHRSNEMNHYFPLLGTSFPPLCQTYHQCLARARSIIRNRNLVLDVSPLLCGGVPIRLTELQFLTPSGRPTHRRLLHFNSISGCLLSHHVLLLKAICLPLPLGRCAVTDSPTHPSYCPSEMCRQSSLETPCCGVDG